MLTIKLRFFSWNVCSIDRWTQKNFTSENTGKHTIQKGQKIARSVDRCTCIPTSGDGQSSGPGVLGVACVGAAEPTADGFLRAFQDFGDVTPIPTLLLRPQRPQPPPFMPVNRGENEHLHMVIFILFP